MSQSPSSISSALRRAMHRLTGSDSDQGYKTRRDRVIARRLQETFDRDLELTRVAGLHLFVQNSVVTLYGTVRHELDRELITSIAQKVPGVKDVVGHLQVVDAEGGKIDPNPNTRG